MEPENSASDLVHLTVRVSRDRDQFFRLTCPSCGRDFKILIDPGDLQWALSSYCQRMGFEIGSDGRDQPPPSRIRCPYCAHEDQVIQMHTEETVTYLRRIIWRELAIPLMNRWASGLEESLGGASDSGGMLSISVEFKHSRSLLPVRPIHGPEPPDLKIVTFLCCGKKAKISEGWTNVGICAFCGTEVAII